MRRRHDGQGLPRLSARSVLRLVACRDVDVDVDELVDRAVVVIALDTVLSHPGASVNIC